MCDTTIQYKNIKDTQNFCANPEDTVSRREFTDIIQQLQNEITTIKITLSHNSGGSVQVDNIIEPVVEKEIKTFTYILTVFIVFIVFTCLFIQEIKTLIDIQEQDFNTLKDIQEKNIKIQNQERQERQERQEIDVVLKNGKFFRNVIVDTTVGLMPTKVKLIPPPSYEIDRSQYHLIKTLISSGINFLTNIELIKQLPNIKTLYLNMIQSYQLEFIINKEIDLPTIKSVYIINRYTVPFNLDYSKLPNLEFLYIYNVDIRSFYLDLHSFQFENLKTLYLESIQWREVEEFDLSHLKSLETLYIDNVREPYRINLSNLNNLTSLTIKGRDISNIDFHGLYNISNLDISDFYTGNSYLSSLLKRLTNLITLNYRSMSIERGDRDELRGVTLKYLLLGGFLQSRQEMLDFGINIRE